jgi:hypothetical protein
MNLKNKSLAILFIFLLLAGTAIYYAPRYLTYADKPVKSDAVILFIGSVDRKKEARRLLDEGYARFLIVPAFKQVFTHKYIPVRVPDATKHTTSKVFKGYPGFYENTHVEVLHAKNMMNAMGLKSAIMVSSPYHMRRIRMISKKVFGEQSRYFSYVPTRYESYPIDLRDMDRVDWMFVIQEYLKICWFRLYSPFIEIN